LSRFHVAPHLDLTHPRIVPHLVSFHRGFQDPEAGAAGECHDEESKRTILKPETERDQAQGDSPSFYRQEPLVRRADSRDDREVLLILD
jgi:hypothetical protein